MFTHSCFIRKNIPALREKLHEMGYDISEISPNSECIATSYVVSKAVGISEEQFDSYNPHRTWNCAGRIDCKDNEELFLAISALRDDTDKYQWFIYDSTDCVIENLRNYEWFICTKDKIEDMLLYDSNFLNAHKATLEEITEHFKQKDNNNDNARI